MHWIYLHSHVLIVVLVNWNAVSQSVSHSSSNCYYSERVDKNIIFCLTLLYAELLVADIVPGADFIGISVGKNSITLPNYELRNAIGRSTGNPELLLQLHAALYVVFANQLVTPLAIAVNFTVFTYLKLAVKAASFYFKDLSNILVDEYVA